MFPIIIFDVIEVNVKKPHILKKEDESEEDAFVCSKILETRGNFDKVSEIKNQRFLSKQVLVIESSSKIPTNARKQKTKCGSWNKVDSILKQGPYWTSPKRTTPKSQ